MDEGWACRRGQLGEWGSWPAAGDNKWWGEEVGHVPALLEGRGGREGSWLRCWAVTACNDCGWGNEGGRVPRLRASHGAHIVGWENEVADAGALVGLRRGRGHWRWSESEERLGDSVLGERRQLCLFPLLARMRHRRRRRLVWGTMLARGTFCFCLWEVGQARTSGQHRFVSVRRHGQLRKRPHSYSFPAWLCPRGGRRVTHYLAPAAHR